MSNISFAKTWASGEVLYAADLEAMKAAIIAVVNGDISNANIASAADLSLSKIGDYSADATEMQTQTNPYPSGSVSLATDIRGELARLRYAVATALGQTYWYLAANKGVAVHTTGDLKWTVKTSADSGWILMNDGTIGETGSGATTRANDDTSDLYTLIYTNFSDTLCPVTGGRGADAATDFAAGKVMRLPLIAGRALAVAGTPASANITDSYRLTATGGTTTSIVVNNVAFSPIDTDHFDDYTVKFTGNVTAALANDTATISAYNKGTFTFTISAVSDAPVNGDTFDIYRTVSTRTLGASVGVDELVLSGDPTGDAAGGGGGTGRPSGFANGTGKIGAHSPTWYGNLMVKL